LFRHAGYIRACDQTGTREIRHPFFEVKKKDDGSSTPPVPEATE
jgi:hypothetical protein